MRLVLVIPFLVAAPASATYSVVATDSATRQVGGAGTSCVGTSSVRVIYGAVPGAGAVHAQALVNVAGRDEAVRLLDGGSTPAEVIARISAPEFDARAAQRQYGVVDLAGRAAAWTGASNGAFAGDRQGVAGGRYAYSVQGNLLTGVRVVEQAEAAFAGGGCDLAERLMRALEAGAANGEGDARCTPSGIPSDSAFIEVNLPGEPMGTYLRLEVTGSRPASPLPALRAQFDAWRATHPCPATPDGGTLADAGEPPPPPDAGVTPVADAGSPPAGSTATPSTGTAPAETGGCGGCGAGPASFPLWALLVWTLRHRAGVARRFDARGRPGTL